MNQPMATETVSISAPGNPWRLATWSIALIIGWTIACYHETAWGMVSIWMRSETFAHGFVVPPITLWLIWRKREEIQALSPRPNLLLLPLIALSGLAWLLGELAHVNALTQLALTAMIVLTVPTVLGWAVARCIAFPLAFLFFAVPIGDVFTPVLMEWTANFTVAALRATGIPVVREGLQFNIPSGSWSVIEACSGIRYLIASTVVGTLFAYLSYHSTKRRLIFFATSIIVPIVANWVRAYMIVMLGHLSGNTLAVGVDHLIYGWVFFGFVIMLMFWIGARWSEPEEIAPARIQGVREMSVGFAHWMPIGMTATIVLLPVLVLQAIDHPSTPGQLPRLAPFVANGNWHETSVGGHHWRPAYKNPSAELDALLEKDGTRVGVYVGYYRNQSYANKLIASTNVLVPSNSLDWNLIGQSSRSVTVDQQTFQATTADIKSQASGNESYLSIWKWYWVDGRFTGNEYLAKVLNVLSTLSSGYDDAAVIIVSSERLSAAVGADTTIEEFLATNGPALKAMLQHTRETRP